MWLATFLSLVQPLMVLQKITICGMHDLISVICVVVLCIQPTAYLWHTASGTSIHATLTAEETDNEIAKEVYLQLAECA